MYHCIPLHKTANQHACLFFEYTRSGVPDGRGLLIALEALISLNLLRSKRFYALLCATLLCYSRGKLSAEASGQGDL